MRRIIGLIFLLVLFINQNAKTNQKGLCINTENGKSILIQANLSSTKKGLLYQILNQKIIFKSNDKLVKKIDLNRVSPYKQTPLIQSITTFKYGKKLYYEVGLYLSNGNAEVFLVYNEDGIIICKSVVNRDGGKFLSYNNSITKDIFENRNIIKIYDTIYLYQ